MEGNTASGTKATGYTEIRNGICEKCHKDMDVVGEVYHCPTCGGSQGELLVAFNSEDAGDYWGNEYQKERIIYAMKHRRDKIPKYLRTGAKSLQIRLFGVGHEAKRLQKINLKEGGQNG